MHLKKTAHVFFAALAGYLLGAMFTHQTTVKAQPSLQVYVQHTWPTIMPLAPTAIPGSQIVGFSCSSGKDGSLDECLIAYVK